jgi:hypothetical protein
MTTANTSEAVKLSGDTMTGLLILSGDPVAALGACTKQYADALTAGLEFKNSVVAASTGALTVTYANGTGGVGATLTNAGAQAAFSIDGQSPIVSDRVLIKNQASTLQNGIYTVTDVGSGVTDWVLTRGTDYDQILEIHPGDLIPVENGTANASTLWLQTATVASIGTDAITFSQFSDAPISLPLSLANGGTNANLTASNGGIFYSTGTAGAILSGTATANQLLLSGSSTTPSWSTSTYPSTNAINTLLYASAANVMSALATANKGVLTTGATGIPVITALATDGQVIIGSTAGVPAAATLTAGTGITITNGGNSISIASTSSGAGATAWVNFNGTTVAVNASLNLTSITDNGVGDYTLNWTASFPSANYVISGTTGLSTGNVCGVFLDRFDTATPQLAASARIWTTDQGGTNRDCEIVNVLGLGG